MYLSTKPSYISSIGFHHKNLHNLHPKQKKFTKNYTIFTIGLWWDYFKIQNAKMKAFKQNYVLPGHGW
jgi:hypothetical protein